MKLIKLLSFIFILLLVLFALALGSENAHLVEINLLVIKFKTSLAILLFSSFLLGMFFISILTLFKKLKP